MLKQQQMAAAKTQLTIDSAQDFSYRTWCRVTERSRPMPFELRKFKEEASWGFIPGWIAFIWCCMSNYSHNLQYSNAQIAQTTLLQAWWLSAESQLRPDVILDEDLVSRGRPGGRQCVWVRADSLRNVPGPRESAKPRGGTPQPKA